MPSNLTAEQRERLAVLSRWDDADGAATVDGVTFGDLRALLADSEALAKAEAIAEVEQRAHKHYRAKAIEFQEEADALREQLQGATHFDASAEEAAKLREQVERLTAEVGEQVALGRRWMERADALEPVARAAVRVLAAFPIIGSPLDTRQEDVVRSLDAAVGALPEALRKEFGG